MPLSRRQNTPDGDNSLIDRDPQNLPVGIGGLRVVWRQRRKSAEFKWWRHHAPNLIASIGLIAALVGAYLAATQPGVAVFARGGDVFVGSTRLSLQNTLPRPDGTTVKVFGSAAAMIVTTQANHSITAVASTESHGDDVGGRCVLTQLNAAELHETCDFWIGAPITAAPTVSSVDVLRVGEDSWKRTYSDGHTVSIPIAGDGAVAPIPLPIGH